MGDPSVPKPTAEHSARQSSADPSLREGARISDPSMYGYELTTRIGPGELIADRFAVEREAGRGGMGVVYRALDRVTGEIVAVKVVARSAGDDDRFEQEARVLAELSHPVIVRYVAHGIDATGRAFLAMEWLDGEDLGKRLSRGALGVAESLLVARRIAEGLAAAHARGIVHRDVKPSNVFLVGGDVARVKLLDFGIVRIELAKSLSAPPMTRTGVILGTVGYMSPEQATADRTLDARADIFAAGCVLFECLTGEPAFHGAHVVAVLAKLLREDAPRVRKLRPDVSPALDELVARMLSKERTVRPADGSALARELEAEEVDVAEGRADGVRSSGRLSSQERRLVNVILAAGVDDADRANEIVQRYAADHDRLADGALLVTVGGRGSMSERIFAAAGCALDLWEAFPSARIALAVGRAQTTGGGAAGPVIDQAAAVFDPLGDAGVRLDEVTCSLLGERFEIRAEEGVHTLVGRRSGGDPPRLLLGKPSPYVGRDRELSFLEATLRECVDESVARAVLVIGPAGQGKSRLRHEFLARAQERSDLLVLSARADPVGAGSSFMLVGQLLRQAIGVREGASGAEHGNKLRAYLEGRFPSQDAAAQMADFLGELVGLSPSECPTTQFREARQDPRIMAESLRRSFCEWLGAECATRPVLVVLEDLHWGDLPSVEYVGEALQGLLARPFMVLALARPEVRDRFPKLWARTERHDLVLGRLADRAAERLVRSVLGSASADSVARIVALGDGNAFYLEELIRCLAEGGSDKLPESVLALSESRLERLEPPARRIARAASVFGEVFWRGGVAALGMDREDGDLEAWLKTLTDREVLVSATESRFPGEQEYAFRHGLLREAAYAMLTDADRPAAHLIAAEWLERVGEKDSLTLADHFEKSGEPRRAVPWLVRGARQAAEGGVFEASLKLAERGFACGAEGADAGTLRLVQGTAFSMRNDWAEAIRVSRAAMDLLPAGSTSWFMAASRVLTGGMFLADVGVTIATLPAIMQAPVPDEPSAAYGSAIYMVCVGLGGVSQMQPAWALVERAEAMAKAFRGTNWTFLQHVILARAVLHLYEHEPGLALATLRRLEEALRRSNNLLTRAAEATFSGAAFAQLGDVPRAEEAVGTIPKVPTLAFWVDWSSHNAALAKMEAGRFEETVEHFTRAARSRNGYLAATARSSLANVLFELREVEAAHREATAIVEERVPFPIVRASAFGTLARVELLRGRPVEALRLAERGLEIVTRAASTLWGGGHLALAVAEALHALGRGEEARTAIRRVRERIERTAATLDDLDLRYSWTAKVANNVRATALERAWTEEERKGGVPS